MEKFAWAVPASFLDALGNCRFERGDRLYDTPRAYDRPWNEAIKHIHHMVQVTFPERSSRPPEDLDSIPNSATSRMRFTANWKSEVRFHLYKGVDEDLGELRSTQGELYTLLWTGDITALEGSRAPNAPRDVREALKALKESDPPTRRLHGSASNFYLPTDVANPHYRVKLAAVTSALQPNLIENPQVLSPEEACLKDPDTFRPTVQIVRFVSRMETHDVDEVVKKVVYQPAPKAKNRRFSITAHGVLKAV